MVRGLRHSTGPGFILPRTSLFYAAALHRDIPNLARLVASETSKRPPRLGRSSPTACTLPHSAGSNSARRTNVDRLKRQRTDSARNHSRAADGTTIPRRSTPKSCAAAERPRRAPFCLVRALDGVDKATRPVSFQKACGGFWDWVEWPRTILWRATHMIELPTFVLPKRYIHT